MVYFPEWTANLKSYLKLGTSTSENKPLALPPVNETTGTETQESPTPQKSEIVESTEPPVTAEVSTIAIPPQNAGESLSTENGETTESTEASAEQTTPISLENPRRKLPALRKLLKLLMLQLCR